MKDCTPILNLLNPIFFKSFSFSIVKSSGLHSIVISVSELI